MILWIRKVRVGVKSGKKTNVSTSCNPDPNVFGLVPGLKDSSEEGPSMGQSIFFPNLEVSIYGPDN